MARSLNKVMLIGNVGKNPEIRYTKSETAVATFSLATSEVWRDRNGNLQERTDWHNIVTWKKLAEITNELVRKGTRLFVEGRIQTRSFEDKSGERRFVTEIVADNVLVLDKKNSKDSSFVEDGEDIDGFTFDDDHDDDTSMLPKSSPF